MSDVEDHDTAGRSESGWEAGLDEETKAWVREQVLMAPTTSEATRQRVMRLLSMPSHPRAEQERMES